jgi:pimeloyl-ACP methyl ester carboxylesterase/acyl carrier protein
MLDELKTFTVKELLDGQGRDFDSTTPLLEWGILDSLSMQTLLGFIRERFGIHVPDEEVRPEQFSTLETIVDLLQRLPSSGPMLTGQAGNETALGALRVLESYGLTRETVDLPGARIHGIRSEGQGPTWVVLPALGSPASSWGDLIRPLVGNQSVVVVDLPGFGQSSLLDAGPGYGAESCHSVYQRTVAALTGYIERSVASPFVLVGHSLGAMLALEVARAFPDDALAVACVGFSPSSDPHGWWHRFQSLREDLSAFFEATYFKPPSEDTPLRALQEQALGSEAFDSMVDESVLKALADPFAEGRGSKPWHTPTLFTYGAHDELIDTDALGILGDAAWMQTEPIARCGHFPQVERSQELLLILQRFFAAQEKRYVGRLSMLRGL